MLRNAVLAILALGVLVGLGRCVWLAMRTDEERIRAMFEEIIAEFNDGGIGPIAAATDEDYRHEKPPLGRDRVLAILRGVVLRDRDRAAKRFAWRLEAQPGETVIEVDETTAEVGTMLAVWRSSGGEWKGPHSVTVGIRLEKRDGEWRIVATTLTWVRGSRMPPG